MFRGLDWDLILPFQSKKLACYFMGDGRRQETPDSEKKDITHSTERSIVISMFVSIHMRAAQRAQMDGYTEWAALQERNIEFGGNQCFIASSKQNYSLF